MMRTIAIGDVHGCSKALRTLLELIDPQPKDMLVFLGDYVDRGPDSRGVVELLMEYRQRCQLRHLMGNHEVMFLACVQKGFDPALWFHMGGTATLASYGGDLSKIPATHLDFLSSALPHLELDEFIFVHANYQEDLAMDDQPEFTRYWEHLTDRMPGPHFSGKTVVCGHTPQASGAIAHYGHLVCLDTYCFGGRWLTALDLGTGEEWQVNKSGFKRHETSPASYLRRQLLLLWNRIKKKQKPLGGASKRGGESAQSVQITQNIQENRGD